MLIVFLLILSSMAMSAGYDSVFALQGLAEGDGDRSYVERFENEISSLYEKNSPAVVRIESCSGQTSPNEKKCSRLGSGFVVDSRGYIITTADVAQEAGELKIFLDDDSCYNGELVGLDKKFNVALLKIDPAAGLPVVELGSAEGVLPGKTVVSINNPYGLTNSVSIGFISGKCRGGFKTGKMENYLQTTIALNPGDIGSPLFSHDGKVIGIMTAVLVDDNSEFKSRHNFFQPLGISFAIPIDLIRNNIEEMIRTGKINHVWLGIEVQNITRDDVVRLNLTDFKKGILVTHVFPNGPAYIAGVTTGDIITGFGTNGISNVADLQMAIAQTNIDEEKNLVIIRENRKITVPVKAKKMPKTILDEKY